MDSDKSLEFHMANCLEKVKYFTWMAVGLPRIPRRALYLGMKIDKVTAILKALFNRCAEYRNLCIIK